MSAVFFVIYLFILIKSRFREEETKETFLFQASQIEVGREELFQ